MRSVLMFIVPLLILNDVIISAQSIKWELLKKQQGNLTLAIHAIAVLGEKQCAVAAYEDVGESPRYFQYIETTKDGGETWHKTRLFPNFKSVNSLPSISSMKYIDEKTIIAVGDSGYIFRTSNAGNTWEIIQNKKYWQYNSVDFVDGKYGIAGGTFGVISITHDSGKTWQHFEKVSSTDFENVYALSQNYFIANTSFHCRQFMTKDLGKTWDSSIISNDCREVQGDSVRGDLTRQLFYTDENNGMFFGIRYPKLTNDYTLHYPIFGTTSDGGKTWDVKDDSTAFPNKIIGEPVFIRTHKLSPYIFAGQWGSEMIYTTNMGKSWQIDSSVLSVINYTDNRDLVFATPNLIYFIGVRWLLKGTIQATDVEDGPRGNPYLFIETNPVPSRNQLDMRIYGLYSINEQFTVRLYDIMGTMVRDYTLQARQRNNGYWTDVSDTINDLGSGVYIAVFETSSAQSTKRILVVP